MISIKSPAYGVTLEYLPEIGWTIVLKGESVGMSLSDHRVLLSLLPFLEIGKDAILSDVTYSKAIEEFPDDLFIKAGLEHGSGSWSKFSIDWLEKSDIRGMSWLIPYLQSIVSNRKKYTQSLRHRARAQLNRI